MKYYYILMKITTWDEMKLVVLNREVNINKPETTSMGFCKVYNSIEECIEDGEDPKDLIVVQE